MNITIELLSGARQRVKRPTEVCLGYRDVYQQDGDLRGIQVIPLEGKVWVTQEGDPEDYILGPGERFTITRRGQFVVQGLTSARFRFAGVK